MLVSIWFRPGGVALAPPTGIVGKPESERWVQIVGRVKPGLSPGEAQVSLQGVYRPLLQALLPRITGWSDSLRRQYLDRKIELVAGGHGRAVLRQEAGRPLVSLMGMVVLVLLIACSNLAGLLAARGAARQREFGIRLAIGASRAQLLRQSIVECLLFTLAGGALGVFVAAWTLHALLGAFRRGAAPGRRADRSQGHRLRGSRLGRAAVLRHLAGSAGGAARPAHPVRPGAGVRRVHVLRFRRWPSQRRWR